ncbi:MAG: hypothetical protein ACREB7_19795 [Sphingopyxis sp.]|uniref:hypothetical protein n=1 Tax=Sphingopyxis sp. TaxID=1908224 RepID=UPI003D6CBDC0
MSFDASLLIPALRRSWELVVAAPVTMLVAWFGIAALALLADVGSSLWSGYAGATWVAYALAMAVIQIWITGEALRGAGYRPILSMTGVLILFVQGLLVGLAILLGLLLLILPAFYVAARFYMSGAILVLHGGGAGAAMWRSWDLLAARWPAALVIGLMVSLLSAAPWIVALVAPAVPVDYGFGWLVTANLISAAGALGGFVTAVGLLLTIEPPASAYRQIFS